MLINTRKLSRICWPAALTGLLFVGAPSGCGSDAPPLPVSSLQQEEGTGKDGDKTISSPGTIVNRYAVLSAAAAPGDKTITLSATAGLGIDALLPLAPDDLLLIIQMQGADIDTSNSASYGSVIDLRSAGFGVWQA